MTENYIHTVEVKPLDNKELPRLVLIHGYGGGGGIFYRIVKDLS